MKKHSVTALLGLFMSSLVSLQVYAQETGQEFVQGDIATPIEEPAEATSGGPGTSKKPRYTEATVSLQTTVTGNQEQPRVLYILPWQSPLSGDIEFQTLSSQQDDVFGHLEREELRRSLEAEAALNTSKAKNK